MSLKCGIVGLPNVGKSTLFNALTKAGIAAENYPFCTIEPNNAAIRAVIAHNQAIPGLRVWSETAAIVTAKAPTAVPATVESFDY